MNANGSGTFSNKIGVTNTGSVITLSGLISGSSNLNVAVGTNGGAGALVLTHASNTYTGQTNILAAATATTLGVLRLGVDNALPKGTVIDFAGTTGAAGAFDLGGFNQTVAGLAVETTGLLGGIINTSNATSTLTIDGNKLSQVRASIGIPVGVGGPNVTGATNNIALVLASTNTGQLDLRSSANTYNGGTSINGGTLLVENNAANSSGTGTGTVTVGASGTFGGTGSANGAVNVSGHLAPGDTISGSFGSAIRNKLAGTLTLRNGLTLNSGSQLDYDFASTPANDKVAVTGGSIAVPGSASSVGFNLNDLGGGFSNTTYQLMTFPAGAYTGADASSFFTNTKPITLGSATLTYALNNANPALATELDLVVSGAPNNLTWTGATDGAWNIGATPNWTGSATTYSNGSNVYFDQTGANTTITVDAGGVAPNVLTVSSTNNQPYSFSGGDIAATGAVVIKGTGAITFANNLTGTAPITVNTSGGGTVSVNGNVSNASAVTVTTGTLVLSGTNTFPGGVSINGGALSISSDANLGNANSVTIAGGSLVANNSFSTSRAIALNASSSVISDPAGTTLTYGGVLSGTGGLTQTGGGTLLLTGNANTYTGNTSVVGGASGSTLMLGASNALPTGTKLNLNGLVSGGNATLDVNGFNQTVAGIALTGPAGSSGTITNSAAGAPPTFTVNNNTNQTFGGVISGNLTLAKSNTGTLALTSTNTYTGGTNMNGGVLAASQDANLGDVSGGLNFNGGTLQATASFATSRAVAVNAGGGTVDTPSGNTLQINGNVTGAGSLTKSGGGALVLAGAANSMGGTLAQTGGTVSVTGNSTVRNINQTAGTLAVNGSGYLHVAASGRLPSSTSILAGAPVIDPGAQLDIEDNALVVQYSASDTTHSVRDNIRNLLKNGRNGAAGAPGAWNGLGGITSSFAHNNGNGFNLAIGYGDNADLAAVRASGSYTSFGGQTVASNTVLVQMTRGADATLDGIVDSQDVTIIGTHFNKPGSGQWCFGDFDYSGTCDSTDVTTLGTTFGKTSPTLSPAQMTAEFGSAFTSAFEAGASGSGAVPEPASLTLIGLGGLALMGRRRSRKGRRLTSEL